MAFAPTHKQSGPEPASADFVEKALEWKYNQILSQSVQNSQDASLVDLEARAASATNGIRDDMGQKTKLLGEYTRYLLNNSTEACRLKEQGIQLPASIPNLACSGTNRNL